MAKNKQSNLIASVKMLNIGFINKYIINSGIGRGGGYPVFVTYQSLLSNIFTVDPPPNYLSLKNIGEIDYSV